MTLADWQRIRSGGRYSKETIDRIVMLHNLAIMIAGLCVFALLAILAPHDFAMPVDDDGNI